MAAGAARRPGPAPSLSRAQVIDSALDVMAADGLDAVSFRSVSKRLGVNPMALYTYVKDKNELLAGMYDTLLSRLEIPAAAESADDQLTAYYVESRRLLVANADLYRLARPVGVPGADLSLAERVFALFAELGLAPAAVVETQLMLMQYTIGNALFTASLGADGLAPLMASMSEAMTDDAESYPHLRGFAELALPDAATTFERTVRAIIRAAAADDQEVSDA